MDKIMVYGHPACPMVPPVLGMLRRSGAAFVYVNLWQTPEAKAVVREINNGYESVPTLVFPDGSTLTEPSVEALRQKLAGLGLQMRPPSLWQVYRERPLLSVLALGMLVFGIADGGNWVFLLLAGVLLVGIGVYGRKMG